MPNRPLLTRSAARRGVAVAVASLLLAAGVTPLSETVAVAAPAAPPVEGGNFSTSFEVGQTPVPYANRVEMDDAGEPVQHNVQGKTSTTIRDSLVTVTASSENPPGEAASRVSDDDPSSKWLTFENAAWVQYDLTRTRTAVSYTLTSGNDFPERDPKDWRLLGSDDGTTWTTLDAQVGQAWAAEERGVSKSFAVATPQAFSRYRLDISANQSGTIMQLAGWDLIPAPEANEGPSPITTELASGPGGGYNLKPLVGFTGVQSLRYGGEHVADGAARATNRLLDVDVAIGQDSRLSYKIFPELTGNDLQYPSTYTAVELHFTDGTYLSDLKPVDSYETDATANGQGTGDILYPNQWNSARIDLGSIAAGKTVDSILLSYDNDGGTAATAFQGFLDDVRIEAQPAKIDGSSLTNYVDTRRGTNSSGAFSRGSDEAITALPNAFNFLVPITDARAQSREYAYQSGNDALNRTRFEGLGISHEPSPWMGDRNQFSLMPVEGSGSGSGDPHARAVTFDHANEKAQPDYYGVTLDNGQSAEMTPTNRGMIMRFGFTGESGSVILDSPTGDGQFSVDASTGSIAGWIDRAGGFAAGQSRMFISGRFDRVPTASGIAAGGLPLTTFADFDTSIDKSVTVRLATSLISLDQAAKNLGMEVGEQRFEQVRNDARAVWNDRLGVITVEGASESELVTLYGNLYRLNVYPNAQFENTGSVESPAYSYASPVSAPVGDDTATTTGAKIVAGKMYVNNGFWDTYRTTWPAYSMLYPDVAAELVDGFTQQYRDGGWVARWSSPGYANIMTGTSSDVAFADAYLRGVDLPDPLATYDAALKNATTPSANDDVGRKSLTTSLFLGYTPASQGESVSWATEGYINDFGIGNIAAALAKDPATPDARRVELREQSAYFLDRATNYVNMFDPAIDFLQARNADGSFVVPADQYDPTAWFGPYTETNGWNFAFHAPQDPQGLANLYGGKAGLESKLDTFFATPETSLGPIHEEVEARDGRFGQWGVSNQVSHHIPYMYNAAGAPAKAQQVVREALRRSFTGSDIGQGYPGDEDNGEMSAWYIFNALGLYPMQAGSSQLVIGSPLFDKATVKLAGGKPLVIKAEKNSSQNVYVQSLTVDGKAYSSTSIDSNLLTDGAELDFVMGSRPSAWGTGADDALPSLTTGDDAAAPLVDTTDPAIATPSTDSGEALGPLFDNSSATEVAFTGPTPTVTIGYAGSKQKPTFYTVTSASTPADPTAWVLEGSDDGTKWTTVDTRTDQVFAERRQTLPFEVSDSQSFQQFRLRVTAGAPTITLSELELLAPSNASVGGPLYFTPSAGATATSGTPTSLRLGTISGGASAVASGFAATVDWGDGTAVEPVTVNGPIVGNFPVVGTHTWAAPGIYRATVTVTDGDSSISSVVSVVVAYLEPTGLIAAFDSVCIADDGTAADCDAKGISFPRAGLAAGGLTQGVEHDVPGTDLRFTLPMVSPGEPDNATGRGQTIALDNAIGATSISFIGAATEQNQDEMATVNFTDGTSAPTPLQFSDWTKGGNAAATAPFGNLEVVKSAYRLVGSSRQNVASFFFSTVPYAVPAGKTVASITMPVQQGQPGTTGRVHVFAIASNGETPPDSSFSAEVSGDITGYVGDPVTATLATIVRADPSTPAPAARVQWGDGSIPEDATVTADEAGALAVTGTHDYATAGEYTVSVTVFNAAATVQLSLTATISELLEMTATTAPTISGTPRIGSTLTSSPGMWSAPDPTLAYQWNRDAQPIDGATSARYTVAAADSGHRLTVTVTANATGYREGSSTSLSVTVRKAASGISGSANRFLSFGGRNIRYSGTVTTQGTVPTGDVTLYDGTKAVATATVDSSGRFTIAVPKLTSGLHLLISRYAGDDATGSSTSRVTLVIVI